MKAARPTTEACAATFGITSLVWPRQALVRGTSRKVCELIVERWARRDANTIRPAVHAWVEQQWKTESLGPDAIIERLKQAAQHVVNEPPEALFARYAQRLAPKGWFARTAPEPRTVMTISLGGGGAPGPATGGMTNIGGRPVQAEIV